MNKKDTELFDKIKDAMNAEPGYHMATEKQVEKLVADGLVEMNNTITEGNKFAVRLTEKGQNYMSGENTEAPAESNEAADNNGFEIHASEEIFSTRRGGHRSSVYPFDKLEMGAFFFIPATEKMPNPAKSMASTVASANKRYGKPTGEKRTTRAGNEIDVLDYERRFGVVSVKKGEQRANFTAPSDGALVQRVK